MSSTRADSEVWLARSALVIALYPLLSVLAVLALSVSFAVVMLPVPNPVQGVVALAGVGVSLVAGGVLVVLTPLFIAALLYDIRELRNRDGDWRPSWWYLLALLVHAGWLYWAWQAMQRLDGSEVGLLGEWYFSIVPLVVGLVLVYYLLARRSAVGVSPSLSLSGGR